MQTLGMFLSRLEGDDRQGKDRDPAGSRGEQLKAIRQRLRATATALESRIATIRTDPSRSEVGKRQAIAELVAKTDLSFLTAMQGEAATDVARYTVLMRTVPKSEHEPLMGMLREREIRDEFKSKPIQERQAAFLEAVKHNKHEVVRAFVEGPLGSLVDADFQQRAVIEHAERSQPALFENFQHAQNLQEHLSSLSDQAQQVLHTLKDDAPVRAVA